MENKNILKLRIKVEPLEPSGTKKIETWFHLKTRYTNNYNHFGTKRTKINIYFYIIYIYLPLYVYTRVYFNIIEKRIFLVPWFH